MELIFGVLLLYIIYIILKWFLKKADRVASNTSYSYSRHKEQKAYKKEQAKRDEINKEDKAFREQMGAKEKELKRREEELELKKKNADLNKREREFKYRHFFKGKDPQEKATNSLKDILKKFGF